MLTAEDLAMASPEDVMKDLGTFMHPQSIPTLAGMATISVHYNLDLSLLQYVVVAYFPGISTCLLHETMHDTTLTFAQT